MGSFEGDSKLLNHYVPVDRTDYKSFNKGVKQPAGEVIAASTDTAQELGSWQTFKTDIGPALRADITEKDGRQKVEAMAGALGVAAVSAVGALRLPTVQALVISTSIYSETGAPPLAGLATGLAYGAWCYTDARVWDSGTRHLQNTAEVTGQRLPLERLSAFLPGINPDSQQSPGIRLARGVSIQGQGIVSYVMAANLQGQTKMERRKLCRNLGIDGALFMGGVATAMTSAVHLVGQQHPQVAEDILAQTENQPLILGVVLGIPIAKMAGKKLNAWVHNKIAAYRDDKRAALATDIQ